MNNLIVEYQRVYQKVVKDFEENEEVLAAFVFGSIVTGDLWDNSDIDFFVILKEYNDGIVNVYSSENDIAVHLKVMSKEEFLNLKEFEIKGSFLHRLFSSSRLVFSIDDDISEKYNSERIYPEMERRKWTLSYLGKLIKSIDSTEKFLNNDNTYGAFKSLLESMDLYSSVYVNSRGYMISKDTINVCANLNSEFKEKYKELVSGDVLETKVYEINKYLKNIIDKEITDASEILIAYLREKDKPLSSTEIAEDDIFKDFDIKMEGILSLLYSKNIIKMELRDVYTPLGKVLIKENVYKL
ncbi:MAG: nucleotidyltransferase domain-containing protein [Clostridium sp.]|nr:nucleotidyltransferase domain-containing protein [Clostridium sp.]